MKDSKRFYSARSVPFSIDRTYLLNIPGETEIEETNLKIQAIFVESNQVDFKEKNIAYFDFEKLSLPIFVRFRKEGDTVELDFGKKKLQDIFVDRKVEITRRHKIPILIDSNDKICWVVSVVRSNYAKIGKNTKKIIAFKAVPLS